MPRWHFRFQARRTRRACSSDPDCCRNYHHFCLNNLLRCRITALADGSASLSCTAGAQYPRHMPSRLFRRKPGLQAAHWLQVHRGKKYHLPSCTYAKKLKTRIFFETAAEAEAQGYSPCGKPVLLQTEIPAANDMHPNSVKRFGAIFYLHFTPIQIDLPDKRKVPPTLLSSGGTFFFIEAVCRVRDRLRRQTPESHRLR